MQGLVYRHLPGQQLSDARCPAADERSKAPRLRSASATRDPRGPYVLGTPNWGEGLHDILGHLSRAAALSGVGYRVRFLCPSLLRRASTRTMFPPSMVRVPGTGTRYPARKW